MSVERLRNIVWLAERQGDTRQTGGDYTSGNLVATKRIFARIEPGAGSRRLSAGGVKTAYPYVVEIRDEHTPKEGQSIILQDGSILTIHSIIQMNYSRTTRKHNRLMLTCARTGAFNVDGKNTTATFFDISENDTITVSP